MLNDKYYLLFYVYSDTNIKLSQYRNETKNGLALDKHRIKYYSYIH